MTTPTREPLTPEELERLTGFMSPYDLTLFNRAIADATAAGREQGIREAALICRTTPPEPFRPSIEAAHAIEQLRAAAIEQLRGK
jgi:hypothetical protein